MSGLEVEEVQVVEGGMCPARPPFISVVVPVRNEAHCIANTIGQLVEQNYAQDRFEIIVVDGESTDNTCQVVEALRQDYSNLKLLGNAKRWSSAARNIGIGAAQGELILIVDGHCDIPTSNYLRELAAAFERTGADCIGRPQPLETRQPSRLQQAIGIARGSWLGHHPASYVFSTKEQRVPAHSIAVAYRRSVFDRVGFFDESFDACEDVELNHRVDRAGMRCALVPSLRVSYHPRATLGGLIRQMFRYGRGRMRLLQKHPDTFSPLGFAPALLVTFVVLGPLGAARSVVMAAVYIGTLSTYAMAILLCTFWIVLKSRRLGLFPLCAIVIPAIHLGAGAGIIRELVSRRPRGRKLS